MTQQGGYDAGYRSCPCFWGEQPGSLLALLPELGIGPLDGCRVWDAGCGEGKNAMHLARLGASVLATDISHAAIRNAAEHWPDAHRVKWETADVLQARHKDNEFEIVIMYGLLHCLPSELHIRRFVQSAKNATDHSGVHLVVAFNQRRQELHAHPGFTPTLMPDSFFAELYSDWNLVFHTDSDLHETHPHNGIPHTHSMTRIIARKP